MSGAGGLPAIHDRPSLHRSIVAHLDAEGRLADPAMALPDEPPVDASAVRFAAGAWDGVVSHHVGGTPERGRAAEVAALVVDAGREPTAERLRRLYGALRDEDALGLVDPLIGELVRLQPPVADVARVGRWLAEASPERAPVKVGIALLGVTGAPDGALLHELGAHEEFTLYAAVAFVASRADPEPDLFRLARAVSGWGRIHCVERLAGTSDPQIAGWILREGFRNTVADGYLAHIAATTGQLAEALAAPDPGRDVLTAAGDILRALIEGGPGEDIDDYDLAPLALSRWLAHMATSGATTGDLLCLDAVRTFLADDGGWEARCAGAWTVELRSRLLAEADELLRRPAWREVVRRDLEAGERSTWWPAAEAARVVGLDVFDALLARIEADPLDGPWYHAWRLADADRAARLGRAVAELLDLDAIASGPSTALGLGPELRPHAALDWTLQGLASHPGTAPGVLVAALRSPSIRNRGGALAALEAWGRAGWTSDHVAAVAALAAGDPDQRLRERAAALLADGGT